MRKQLMAVTVALGVLVVAPACATKGFVRESVGDVNEKVGTLGKSLEETQERVKQNEQKISDVDGKAAAAGTAAGNAQKAADAAAGQAQAAQAAGKQADARAAALEAETRKLILETVISEDSGKFQFGTADLPDGARQAIDQLVARVKGDRKNVWIEIEGHTDNVGDEKYNEALGLQRADAVKRYLYEQHQIPLHKMSTISYGERKPAAENRTRDGRAQNRRVVIKVLS